MPEGSIDTPVAVGGKSADLGASVVRTIVLPAILTIGASVGLDAASVDLGSLQLLAELAESTTLLGADKLSRLHSKLIETKSMTRAQLPAIHKVLLELEAALAVHVGFSQQEGSPH